MDFDYKTIRNMDDDQCNKLKNKVIHDLDHFKVTEKNLKDYHKLKKLVTELDDIYNKRGKYNELYYGSTQIISKPSRAFFDFFDWKGVLMFLLGLAGMLAMVFAYFNVGDKGIFGPIFAVSAIVFVFGIGKMIDSDMFGFFSKEYRAYHKRNKERVEKLEKEKKAIAARYGYDDYNKFHDEFFDETENRIDKIYDEIEELHLIDIDYLHLIPHLSLYPGNKLSDLVIELIDEIQFSNAMSRK